MGIICMAFEHFAIYTLFEAMGNNERCDSRKHEHHWSLFACVDTVGVVRFWMLSNFQCLYAWFYLFVHRNLVRHGCGIVDYEIKRQNWSPNGTLLITMNWRCSRARVCLCVCAGVKDMNNGEFGVKCTLESHQLSEKRRKNNTLTQQQKLMENNRPKHWKPLKTLRWR